MEENQGGCGRYLCERANDITPEAQHSRRAALAVGTTEALQLCSCDIPLSPVQLRSLSVIAR